MKLSPTVTLALAIAAGMAGAAVAQNSATPGTASTSPQTTPPTQATAPMSAGSTTSQGQPSYTQPQENATQTQPSQTQPSYGQAQIPNNAPNNANEQVRTAQQQLRAAGFYNGPVDGVMDPDTRAAIARFQQQNGLQQTQSLDQQTLAQRVLPAALRADDVAIRLAAGGIAECRHVRNARQRNGELRQRLEPRADVNVHA